MTSAPLTPACPSLPQKGNILPLIIMHVTPFAGDLISSASSQKLVPEPTQVICKQLKLLHLNDASCHCRLGPMEHHSELFAS